MWVRWVTDRTTNAKIVVNFSRYGMEFCKGVLTHYGKVDTLVMNKPHAQKYFYVLLILLVGVNLKLVITVLMSLVNHSL